MTDDPNVPPDPDDLEPEAPPEPPPVDLDAAYRVVADNEGWDPRVARFEMQEFKRRREEFEREKREFQERTRTTERTEPAPDFGGDQYAKMLYENKQETAELKRMLVEREKREKEKEYKEELIQQIGGEVDSAFTAVARQAGMTRDQVGSEMLRKEFFQLLTDMYPEPDMIEKLGADRAVRNAFRAFKGGNGTAPHRPLYRDPRASFTVPVGSSGGPMGDDAGPRRSNESQADYVARLKRVLDEAGAKMSSLPERAVINPG